MRKELLAGCWLLSAGLTAGLSIVVDAAPRAVQRPVFSAVMPGEEYARRRAEVMRAIGDGVAVVQGATERPVYKQFRQGAHFFYLTGVEVPRAVLLIDGKARASTLFLLPRDERMERSEGPVLTPGPEAEKVTGIERVLPRDGFDAALAAIAAEGRQIFTTFRPEALEASTSGNAATHARKTAEDKWDGRKSREDIFREKLAAASPKSEIADLDRVLDKMRLVKSAREIAAVREASRMAGEAMMEAMRVAKPGMRENEIEAAGDFVFKAHGSQGVGYFALVAGGTNASYPHYHGGKAELKNGELVLFDYAPDFNYYTSDVTRMFPANGTFTARQREMYGIYLELYNALMTSIRPHVTPKVVLADAYAKMQGILARFTFADPKVREAATRFVANFANPSRNSLGHWIGMEVHDVSAPYETLEPGMMFTIEPALTIPDERIYIRLEDAILITETGYENMSGFVPAGIDDIERIMREEPKYLKAR
ncbi:MAG: Xaa-Pro peptidase family protein [Acidobacteriota bacterium]|nr:Xaa-Pro peptidase family protein [Acidobacteriota bacterium]